MKLFTSLMKALITIVSISLTVMLIVTAAPLVMGGIEVENTEEITITQDGSNLDIQGILTIKSSLPKDITNLIIRIDAISLDDKNLDGVTIYDSSPRTIEKGTNEIININRSVNIAEVLMFILADTGSEVGIFLPIQISVSADYGGLAGFDMKAVSVVKLSEEGYLECDVTKNNEGEIYSASAIYHGNAGDMLMDLIPAEGLAAEISVLGDDSLGKISLDVVHIAGEDNKVQVVLKTGDGPSSIGLLDLADKFLKSDGTVQIALEAGGAGLPLNDEKVKEIINYLEIFLGGISDE